MTSQRVACSWGKWLAVLALLTTGPTHLMAQEGTAEPPKLRIDHQPLEAIEIGRNGTQEFRVINVGRGRAENVMVTMAIAKELEVLDAAPSPMPGHTTGPLLRWELPQLDPGEQADFRVHFTLKSPGLAPDITSKVTASFSSSVELTQKIGVKSALDLQVGGPESVLVDEEVPYRLVVNNISSHPVRNIMLATTLGEGLKHPSGQELGYFIGDLDVGQSRTVFLQVTPQKAGKLEAMVKLLSDGTPQLIRKLPVQCLDVRLDVAIHGPTMSYLGWPCSYNFVLVNQATDPSPPLRLAVHLPKGIKPLQASQPGGGYAAATHSIIWDLKPLQPGENRVVSFNGTVQQKGDLEGQMHLKIGNRVIKQTQWSVKVGSAKALESNEP